MAGRLASSIRMSLDDLVLVLQHAIDRLVRRFRRGASPMPTHRRLLVVLIDGLSRVVLEQGLASGFMPFLNQLLRRHGYRLDPMTVGLPTSTPAFQMAAMYGVRPDIPGFHYYDRERQSDIHFPRKGHAAMVEARQAAGRLGILRGGSAYGCVFTGGAENDVFTFASLTRQGPFANRSDAALVAKGIADLMTMPSAGDLVIYGIDAAQGHVSFIPEMGTHAGPSSNELHTFIVRPEQVSLPSPISHPAQLYDHFIRYQQPS